MGAAHHFAKRRSAAAGKWGRCPMAVASSSSDSSSDEWRHGSAVKNGPTDEGGRLPRSQLLEFLGEMQLIRRFEEKVIERFRAGDLAGFLHACIGQEAVAVGFAVRSATRT